MRSITFNPWALITGVLLTILLVLALLFAGQMGVGAYDSDSDVATLYLELDQRLDNLESEIEALKKKVAGSHSAAEKNKSSSEGNLQIEVARILNDMSDRWMRSISGSLSEIHRDLENLNRTIASK